MSTTTVILAQLEVEGCTAELLVNGVPLSRIAPPKMFVENVAAETFLIPGTNRLDVLVEPGETPSTARAPHREIPFRPMRATGRLIRFPEGVPGTVEHGELLAETAFVWEDGRPSRRTFPVEVGTQVEILGAGAQWPFLDAPPLSLDDALVAEARALLDEVEQAIRAADADRIFRLAEIQLRDVQRAYPAVTDALLRADVSTRLQETEKSPDPVLPRDPGQHDFRLVAGDRVLQLVDRDWTTSFKLRDPGDGGPIPYRILVARIDGVLRIVR
jgi:hypothetical protein